MPEQTRTIGARTEHLDIGRAAHGRETNARVDWIEHLGDQNHLHISVGDQKIVTLADPYADINPGDEIVLDRIELEVPDV